MKRLLVSTAAAAMLWGTAAAQVPESSTFPALGAPEDPSVQIVWNRFYDVDGINMILEKLHEAHPDKTKLTEIGESAEGRKIMALELFGENDMPPDVRPAMYIDGNIHGNEVQCAEVVLYTAWYLLEMYDEVEAVKELVDNRTFYLLPSINPDGRDHWLHGPANPHLSRGGRIPVDNDQDGQFDEDGPDDIDGDGQITRMRIKDPFGRWCVDDRFPETLMYRVESDEIGEYSVLGWEGIDNDGDGEINEDGPGGYDPNRNWPYNWQPESTQFGAMAYPFSLPETRAVSEFVLAHPNIAAMQSYHNTGGMILRGPGDDSVGLNPADDRIAQLIGKRGEEMLPFYNSWVTYKDLYRVFGGEFDWFYGMLGIIGFTNEMYTDSNMFRREAKRGQEGNREEALFLRHLLQNQGVTPWAEYDHPTYGKVEIGGTAKNFGRVPPAFMLEEELHRNMASTLYHANAMPKLSWGESAEIEDLGDGVRRVRVSVVNSGLIPTRLSHDIDKKLTPRNSLTVKGGEVVASGVVKDRYNNIVEWQKVRPERLLIETVPGQDQLFAEFLVVGDGDLEFRFEATKGGVLEMALRDE